MPLPADTAVAVDALLVVVDVSGVVVFCAEPVTDCPELLEHPPSTTPIVSVIPTKNALIFCNCNVITSCQEIRAMLRSCESSYCRECLHRILIQQMCRHETTARMRTSEHSLTLIVIRTCVRD